MFTIFSLYGRYLIADYRSDVFFPDGLRDVALTTKFSVKIGEIIPFTFILPLASHDGVEYRNSDFKMVTCDDVATLYKILVNICQ